MNTVDDVNCCAMAVTVDRHAASFALFALGRFVQYRLDEGMSEAMVAPFKQAYLTLREALTGLPSPDLASLPFQTTTDQPAPSQASRPDWPEWLRGLESPSPFRPPHDSDPCTTAQRAQAE